MTTTETTTKVRRFHVRVFTMSRTGVLFSDPRRNRDMIAAKASDVAAYVSMLGNVQCIELITGGAVFECVDTKDQFRVTGIGPWKDKK